MIELGRVAAIRGSRFHGFAEQQRLLVILVIRRPFDEVLKQIEKPLSRFIANPCQADNYSSEMLLKYTMKI